MPESTVTVKVELSDESKRLIEQLTKPWCVATCDPPEPCAPQVVHNIYWVGDEEPTPARNEYMDSVIGQTIKFHNYAEEILRIAERCKTVAEFDEATDIFVGSIDGDEDNFWNAVLQLAYQERYGE